MSQVNQRQGVYVTTMNVLADSGKSFDDGQAGGVKAVITDSEQKTVIGLVTQGLLSGEIEMSTEARAKYSEEKTMKSYASGLVNNWFRKDPRLNGDTKYVAKNPGSRQGSGDAQLKALKAFRATLTTTEDQAAVDQAIEARKAELSVAKTPAITEEQIALLPESLRALLKI